MNLYARKLSYEELVEAGVDLSDPENYNTFGFDLTLTFAQMPVPVQHSHISNGHEDKGGGHQSAYEEEKEKTGIVTDTSEIEIKTLYIEEENERFPVLAYVVTRQSISWLKDMYEADLTVFNAADTSYVITDSRAVLNLPEGLSLAATEKGQTEQTVMGEI